MQETRKVEPGPTAQSAVIAIAAGPRIAIVRCTAIRAVPAILDPLPHIAVHVIKAKGVGRKTTNRTCLIVIPLASTAITIGPVAADIIAPAIAGCGARACRIFPFCFTEQTIGLTRFATEPRDIALGMAPNSHASQDACPGPSPRRQVDSRCSRPPRHTRPTHQT